MPKFAANLSMLFNEVDFLERFKMAAQAGFKGVEIQFPYSWERDTLRAKLNENGLQQVLFNMPPGDWKSGERGIACLPNRIDEFKRGVDLAIEYAMALNCPQINCLAGIAPQHIEDGVLRDNLTNNLAYAADQLSQQGIGLLVEAINSKIDIPGFFLDTSQKVLEVIKDTGSSNIKLQYDCYHMQIMEGDLVRTITNLLQFIGHIQIADNPGRHEPGSGEIHFEFIFKKLDDLAYPGWVSAEYLPSPITNGKTDTLKSLDWMF
ncbi:MAG: hydroxypyruvate isomerase [Deltaproteobacteria bacterium]|jgi:hydroxypyruvate isomerase|nr:hydroxypyruvate isomerase [Deltaproteobacteria bacterium]MBT4266837.1 hydroxypyruvate isomerase [Deltaproteobacteria bacterium]MBT4640848.1 hydroxypyruvate isomerase [Deltaproteobacteria bacterium]MBT6502369.1 hydroxypyruvate isomerase [Deltaproteobacteria bacterium]MBT7155868.1 hydroxypyruvate isomerase [Deltaproteobacteria bacterium]